ncbi:MAG: hypothetical protein JXA22_03395 [Candidatus Thermoplasmatota archaeon]|nr:hypothetical protein [Candidatus Thermoplasmatota archaeon]
MAMEYDGFVHTHYFWIIEMAYEDLADLDDIPGAVETGYPFLDGPH